MSSYSTSWWSLLLINRPHEDERLSWPCWLTYSGRLTHINGQPSAAGPVQISESSPVYHWAIQPTEVWQTSGQPLLDYCPSTASLSLCLDTLHDWMMLRGSWLHSHQKIGRDRSTGRPCITILVTNTESHTTTITAAASATVIVNHYTAGVCSLSLWLWTGAASVCSTGCTKVFWDATFKWQGGNGAVLLEVGQRCCWNHRRLRILSVRH